MAQNDFLPFATAATANVQDQASYAAAASRTNGAVAGYAKSAETNKAIRQPSFISAGLAEWVNEQLVTVPILDDGNLAEWIGNLDAALRRLILSYIRVKLTGALTVYVSCFSGNDLNNGLSPATPFRTIQAGINYMLNNIDAGPYQTTVAIEGGSGAVYNESIQIGSSPLGTLNMGQFQLTTHGGLVTINGTGYTFAVSGGAMITLNGQFLLSAVSTAQGPNAVIAPISGARVGILGNGVTFGNSPGCYHVYSATGGEFGNGSGTASYTIAGGGVGHWFAVGGGRVTVLSAPAIGSFPTITLTGTPNFSNPFAMAQQNGVIGCGGLSFVGTGATCTKYFAYSNGVIDTQAAGASYLPGNVAGSVGAGGQYV